MEKSMEEEKKVVRYCISKGYLTREQARKIMLQYRDLLLKGVKKNLILFLSESFSWDTEQITDICNAVSPHKKNRDTQEQMRFKEYLRVIQEGKIDPVTLLTQLYNEGKLDLKWLEERYLPLIGPEVTAIVHEDTASEDTLIEKDNSQEKASTEEEEKKIADSRDEAGLNSPKLLASSSVPEKIFSYRLGRRLGMGGMGVVYEGKDEETGEQVAIKLLIPTSNEEILQRFGREIKVLLKLSHPNIVRFLNWGIHEEYLYLIMEMIDGFDLGELIRRVHRFEPLRALSIIMPVCGAIEYSAKLKVVHRDLKPGNILLDPRRGLVKVADFGLAKIIEESSLTISGTIMGTPYYMAPEQIEKSKHADIRADIYALGAVLYHMLTGQAPFQDKPYHDIILLKKEKKHPLQLEKLGLDLSSPLAHVILKAMANNPNERFQTPTQMRVAMEKIYSDLSKQKK